MFLISYKTLISLHNDFITMLKKILVADDDESIVDALTWMLESYGYEVVSTYDGSRVAAAMLQIPALLVLDTWMSGIDGRDVCKAVKTNPLTSHIPVLMISASHEIRESALLAGADDFLAKPFEMHIFLDLVSTLCL